MFSAYFAVFRFLANIDKRRVVTNPVNGNISDVIVNLFVNRFGAGE